MNALAAVLALCVGLALGLLGGGGGILAVPIFVYALGVPAKSAVAMSHAVVGSAALMGFLSHRRQYAVNVRAALLFGAFAMVGAMVGARLSRFVSADTQLVMFASVALVAGGAMWRNATSTSRPPASRPAQQGDVPPDPGAPRSIPGRRLVLLAVAALGIGTLTSIIGVGGGFLIVPVLVVLMRLDMREAIGTSLLAITMNAASALAGYIGQVPIGWRLVIPFTLVAIAGSLAGARLVGHIDQRRLKQAFAVLVMGVAVYVIYKRH